MRCMNWDTDMLLIVAVVHSHLILRNLGADMLLIGYVKRNLCNDVGSLNLHTISIPK